MPDRFSYLGDKAAFWAAVVAAVIIKLMTVRTLGFWGICTSVASALFFAVIFTEPVIDWWGWSRQTYEPAVAAVLALFGEHIARLILQSKSVEDLIRAWRAK